MAQSTMTIRIDVNEKHEVRQKNKKGEWTIHTYTLRSAYEEYAENVGEDYEPISFEEWLAWHIPYGYQRTLALGKDGKRFDRGEKPTTIYQPRTAVKGAKKNADALRAEAKAKIAKALGVTLHEPKEKKAPTRKAGGAAVSL